MASALVRAAIVLCSASVGVACGSPARPSGRSPFTVTTEPAASLDAVPPVVRLHVGGIGPASSALLLVRGELSSYFASRLRQGELPSTLADRRVEAIAWNGAEPDDAVLAPSVALVPGETYALAALGAGPIATFVVALEAAPIAERIWPPRHTFHAGTRSVFCTPSSALLGEGTVRLDPLELTAMAILGTDGAGNSSDRCVHLDAVLPVPIGVAIPPPAIGETPMDPSPLALDPTESSNVPLGCSSGEVVFGPGCGVVLDDRVTVRSADSPLLWSLQLGDRTSLEPMAPGGRFVLAGLSPSSDVVVAGTATALGGEENPFLARFRTGNPRPHAVINEVLANPLGPEPAQEWVELVNDGASPIDLGGFVLSDSGGDVVLPKGLLKPGGFALVVGSGFEASGGQDPPPAPGTVLLRVPRVGSAGLSNSGEALRLTSDAGQLLSRFPAIAAARPGVSAVRRNPSSPDEDKEAFFSSPDGGSTPGRGNGSDASGASDASDAPNASNAP
jgi:hypothetical protein